MDRYVRNGIELAWEAFRQMADGEKVECSAGEVTCPEYAHIPQGCLVSGLFTPVRINRTWGDISHVHYMELPSLGNIDDPSEDTQRILMDNETAYVWWAENGHRILQKLAARRNDAVICVRVPESVKKNLEKMAGQRNMKITDLLKESIDTLLASS